MIAIRNLRTSKPQNPWDVVVDRSSILGNPFRMTTKRQRNSVCDQYDTYFCSRKDAAFQNELERLIRIYKRYGKLNLYCWCAPKRCHADTIRAYILEQIFEESRMNNGTI